MPDEPVVPEPNPGNDESDEPAPRVTNGSPPAPPVDAADLASADIDQTLADIDQTLSDSDQTLSDSDQFSPSKTRRKPTVDEKASQRDQRASDRDRCQHAASDTAYQESYAASQADRARGTAERHAASERRSINMFERADNAVRRDEQASLRDLQAAARDRAAELRDRAADEHEQALGRKSHRRWCGAGDGGRGPCARRRGSCAARPRIGRRRQRIARRRRRRSLALTSMTSPASIGLAWGRSVLQREIDRARRGIGSLILAYCDVDGLKKVNDGEGHAAGDALLKVVADVIRSRLRSYDTMVRVGGDEFVCALTEVDLEQAAGIFGEIQTALGEMRKPVSMSYGLARLRDGDSLAELMDRSDGALRKSRVSRR